MGLREVAISGLVAGVVAFILSIAYFMSPFVSDFSAQYAGWTGYKGMESFGGYNNWLIFLLLGNIITLFFAAVLYSYTEAGIDVENIWKKGAFFGFLVFLVSSVPTAYFKWLLYSYSDVLNMVDIVGMLINGVVSGIVLAIVYEKLSKKK